ncbi:MAG: ABC transporter substrate-binding protein [Syntrophomonadaceae bacterium]|jgi:iron complex transport system substrate-binding protein
MSNKYAKLKAISIVLTLMLIVTGLTGCANTEKQSNPNPEKEATTLTLTDMAGRQVVVPKAINKVYSAVPIGTVMIYTIDPGKLGALNFKLSELEKKYTVEEHHNLPVLGNYIMGSTANEEDILKLDPDIIVYVGIINDSFKAQVEEAQQRLGIPIVMVDGNLKNAPAAYEFTGKLLGEEKRAGELAEYCRQTLAEAEKTAGKIPEDSKARVYYACGADGLMTYVSGNIHSEVIDIVGGKNIAEIKVTNPYQNTQLSMEQLMKWNPDLIITNKVEARGGEGGPVALRTKILENSNLGNLEAVKNQQIYEIPCAPFSWFGQPPSVARILGIKWLGNLLYPDEFKYDIKKEAKDFYKLFYNYDLTDQDLEELMSNATRK